MAIIVTVVFNYWLRKWQYGVEYRIRNVERIYVPVLSELNDRIIYLNGFLDNPNALRVDFPKQDELKKSGFFEFIIMHDKKLYSDINKFYNDIRPLFEKLLNLRVEKEDVIMNKWKSYTASVLHEKIRDVGSSMFSDKRSIDRNSKDNYLSNYSFSLAYIPR